MKINNLIIDDHSLVKIPYFQSLFSFGGMKEDIKLNFEDVILKAIFEWSSGPMTYKRMPLLSESFYEAVNFLGLDDIVNEHIKYALEGMDIKLDDLMFIFDYNILSEEYYDEHIMWYYLKTEGVEDIPNHPLYKKMIYHNNKRKNRLMQSVTDKFNKLNF